MFHGRRMFQPWALFLGRNIGELSSGGERVMRGGVESCLNRFSMFPLCPRFFREYRDYVT